MKWRARDKEQGVTLLETMIAVAILGILVGFALPSFREMIIENRLSTETSTLVANLNYARSEAIRQNSNVTVCASSSLSQCDSTDWTAGWIVFTDGAPLGTVNSGDTILRVHQPDGNTSGSISLSGGSNVQFSPTGALVAMDMSEEPSPHRLERFVVWVMDKLPMGHAHAAKPNDNGNGNNGNGNHSVTDSGTIVPDTSIQEENTTDTGASTTTETTSQTNGNGNQITSDASPTFSVCQSSGSVGRSVSVNANGRISAHTITCP